MELLVDIQKAQVSARLDTYGDTHAVVGPVLSPSLKDIQVLERIRFIHLHKADRARYFRSFFQLFYFDIGKGLSKRLKFADTDRIRRERLHLGAVGFHQIIDSMIVVIILYHDLAGIRKL